MQYRSLEALFHADRSNERFTKYAALADERRSADSAFRTGIFTDDGELFMAVPRELSVLLENVLRFERVISKLAGDLPPVATGALIRDLIIREVVSTNELEGVHSTRRQISDVLETHRESAETIKAKRFSELVKLYLNLTEPNGIVPTTPEEIRSIYDQVMRGEDLGEDAPDGKVFRRREVAIYSESGIEVHAGLYPESRIIDAVERMLEIVNSDEVPQIYSSIIGHFVFEYIHPFYDGNGRTGRYLLALWLNEPLSLLTSLSLSRITFENKDAYYRAFKRAEHPLMHGELTFFVISMLELVRQAQDELDSGLREKKSQLDAAAIRLDSAQRDLGISDQERSLLYLFSQVHLFASVPSVRLAELADYLECSVGTARKYSRLLEEKSLIEPVTRSPLRFVLTRKALDLLGIRQQTR
jgi:Fic family protein